MATAFGQAMATAFGQADVFFDGCDFLSGVPCMAGELELEMHKLVEATHTRDDARKGYVLANPASGPSNLSIMAADFSGPDDYLDDVALEELATDAYGTGRHSSAESASHLDGGLVSQQPGSWALGSARGGAPGRAHMQLAPVEPEADAAHDSEGEHTQAMGDGGRVGDSHRRNGASGSEASEEDTFRTTGGRALDEEHMSMPSFRAQHHAAPPPHSAAGLVRAASSDSPFVGLDAFAVQQRQRPQMFRSQSYIVPRSSLLGDSPFGADAFVAGGGLLHSRGRSVSFNDGHVRPQQPQLSAHHQQQWPLHHHSELLAPQLPPSASELELLEAPEEGPTLLPARHHSGRLASSASLALSMMPAAPLQPVRAHAPAPGAPPAAPLLASGAPASAAGAGTGAGAAPLKRKAPAPSPLRGLSAGPVAKKHHVVVHQKAAAAQAAAPPPQGPKGVSLKAKPAAAASQGWQAGNNGSSSLYMHDSRFGGAPGAVAGAGMRTARSMPTNLESFLQGYEVGVAPTRIASIQDEPSPNNSSVSASTPQQGFFSHFYDQQQRARAAAVAVAGAAGSAAAPAAVAAPIPPPVVPEPKPRASEGKRGAGALAAAHGPSAAKPKKRASPNGAPPKAPAPNPNGHCCTQCGTQTTPVWRAGPHGPKTLCNACGVRYMKVAKKK